MAAEVFAAAKEKRRLNREKIKAAKAGLKVVDRQMDQLRRAPLDAAVELSTNSDSVNDSESHPKQTTPEAILTRARELLEAHRMGDKSAESELTNLVDQYPALMHRLGDIAQLARGKWLSLIVGRDPVFRMATIKKLEDLRSRFPANDDPVNQLLVERILASWLQLAFFEGKMAESGSLDREGFGFYSRLQQKALRHHMQAIRNWNHFQNIPGRNVDDSKSDDVAEAIG